MSEEATTTYYAVKKGRTHLPDIDLVLEYGESVELTQKQIGSKDVRTAIRSGMLSKEEADFGQPDPGRLEAEDNAIIEARKAKKGLAKRVSVPEKSNGSNGHDDTSGVDLGDLASRLPKGFWDQHHKKQEIFINACDDKDVLTAMSLFGAKAHRIASKARLDQI